MPRPILRHFDVLTLSRRSTWLRENNPDFRWSMQSRGSGDPGRMLASASNGSDADKESVATHPPSSILCEKLLTAFLLSCSTQRRSQLKV
jgi:hypothetical protein